MDIHTLIRSEKDSISIPELRKMLGIGKTESYWLIQNRGIKTFQLRGCMRVRNKDFWDWYDTILVLKTPKTTSSVRKVYMPSAVARMLVEWKQAQDEKIELLGAEYQNYDLVFAGSLGMPTEASTINDALHRLIKEHDLPPIVFHSLRHSSITYKLKLNGGDIKAVQGDSGHSQAKMVTDTYSHILDDGRKNNALLFQEAFYEAKTEPKEKTPEGLSPETLSKMLANPEVMALLTALAKQMG